jgi:D-xylose transport system substrate-binding protein
MGDKANGGNVVMMNGDPISPNAAWYRRSALSVLTGKVKIARSYDTLGWSTDHAHANMSAAIAALGPDRIGGVLAANDAIAAGVISALNSARVRELPPVTGQDADLDAVQRIIKGQQYMTVYKPFRTEAAAAAAMAVALGRGEGLSAVTKTTTDSPTTKHIPSVLLTPSAVTVGNIKQTLVKDGVYTIDRICTRELRPACDKAGLTG